MKKCSFAASALLQTRVPIIRAYGSGARSALIKDPHSRVWYRLKGCGMPDVGFTVVDVLNDVNEPVYLTNNGSKESISIEESRKVLRKIRGASYPHTCSAEMRMSELIDSLLKPVGLKCGNRPVGRWDYNEEVGSEFPMITRACGVYETLGDRRLGDHVLRGIEMILPKMIGDRQKIIEDTLNRLDGTGLIDMGMGRFKGDFYIDGDVSEFFNIRLNQITSDRHTFLHYV
jgi:hypothetical protein